ncbi:uncharacterized protein N7483_006343 [Penicillium malachiteum]|uniref:uncharacterized protein n=1 Tax=Penicillium malachiteum TaxID=1324776 RepID=UPI002549666F|nr:uncharacterized protein N7483_006343 [Penicillium malachiteum]KAJ5724986.1 hypothetical protein N7483_006343 [Penicillium malachiteum]
MAESGIALAYRDRPVAIIGCGVMGRRIALIWAQSGFKVSVFDKNCGQVEGSLGFLKENLTVINTKLIRNVCGFHDLRACVKGCWLVIEAIPEHLESKIELFGELEQYAPHDAIIATNSSSYRSSLIAGALLPTTRSRTLNTHYHMPPVRVIVELISCGHTNEEMMIFMEACQKEVHIIPYIVRQESTGFILNRVWAAIKREVLTMLADGVSTPTEIDEIWGSVIESTRPGPCRVMDETGPDTVAAIEQNSINERGLFSIDTVNFLRESYIFRGKSGSKCEIGGLYSPSPGVPKQPSYPLRWDPAIILAIDNAAGRVKTLKEGRILAFNMMGMNLGALVVDQFLPDGVDVDRSTGRIFWTCMGKPGKPDGAIYSANLDGTDINTVLPDGGISTPKQLCLDSINRQIYFSNREGKRIYRCDYSGSQLKALVENCNGGEDTAAIPHSRAVDWCVSLAVSLKLEKIFLSQKGPPKGGMGRIFSAGLKIPPGETAITRKDPECLLYDLPEPIHLDVDEENCILYWTDRGEMPLGNSVNCLSLDRRGTTPSNHTVLVRNLHEAIGLALNISGGLILFADSGGRLYSSNLDGTNKKVIYSGEENFTGIALA